ncbi:MAG: acetolactate synthase small subunit [Clostridiales bacterium]|nr:acetolactate synthase small subunit [Clostridiales bacterium]
MKKRCISLLVENDIGVLARISGLFSGKSYNLDSLTVGTTEDTTISRMTITLTSDDQTFEQIKKQLNRSIEVIKVMDFTDMAVHMKELMFVKIHGCLEKDMVKITCIKEIFQVKLIDYNASNVLIESVQTEGRNNELIRLLEENFPGKLEIVRGGNVAIEAISISEK